MPWVESNTHIPLPYSTFLAAQAPSERSTILCKWIFSNLQWFYDSFVHFHFAFSPFRLVSVRPLMRWREGRALHAKQQGASYLIRWFIWLYGNPVHECAMSLGRRTHIGESFMESMYTRIMRQCSCTSLINYMSTELWRAPELFVLSGWGWITNGRTDGLAHRFRCTCGIFASRFCAGDLPPELGYLTALTYLHLGGNKLTGEKTEDQGCLLNHIVTMVPRNELLHTGD